MGTLDQNPPPEYHHQKTDGDRLLEEGHFPKAKLALEGALEALETYYRQERDLITGKLFEANRGVSESFLEAAEAALAAGNEELAAESFEAALEAAPDQSARDRVRLAMTAGEGTPEGRDSTLSAHLQRHYDKVLRSPDDPGPCYDFAVELALDGYLDAAAAQFERAVELSQGDPEAQGVATFRLANVYHDLEMLEEAREAYKRAFELGYDKADVHFRLGTIHEWDGDDDKAREEFLACLQENPDHLSALEALARSHEHQDAWDEALGYHRRVVAVDPEDAETLYRIGEILGALERTDEAIKTFEQVLAVDPEGEFAGDAQERIQEMRA